jgi:RNA polymerase sigma-70 factor (ECF subfamily)
MTDERDAELVRACRRGDASAFGSILERYQRPVFNAALRMLGNRDDASDVTQTVFLKVYEHLDDYDSRFRLYSWIYRIALNESIDFLKHRRDLPLDAGPDATEPARPEDLLDEDQTAGIIAAALLELPDDYRSVIVLRHFVDLSYREMSAVLEVQEKTVKSRLFTARELLRAILTDRAHT